MRKNALPIFILVSIALVIYGVISLNKKSTAVEEAEADIVVEAPTPPSQIAEALADSAQAPDGDGNQLKNQNPAEAQVGGTPASAADVNFALSQMSKCLGLQRSEFDQSMEVTAANFQAALPYDLGMVLFQEDEWTSKDIRLPSGEVRRVTVQYYPGAAGAQRKTLRYTSIQNGQVVELPLEADQKSNPSDSLIASLEMDGEPVNQRTSKKAFLQHGGEVHMTENQGVLSSFELTSDGRSFRCKENLKHCECP